MKHILSMFARLVGWIFGLVGIILTAASVGPIYMLATGQISPGDRMFSDIQAPSLTVAVAQALIGLALSAIAVKLTNRTTGT
jgi:hypothetical protein